MKLTVSNTTQLQTKILDLLFVVLGPGAPQLAIGIQGRSFCQHLCSGTCPVVGQGPDASGCQCLCMASAHLQNLGPTHQPWGEEEDREGPAACIHDKPVKKNHTRTMWGFLFGVALLQQCWLQATHPALALPLLLGLFRVLMSIEYRVACTQILPADFVNPKALP